MQISRGSARRLFALLCLALPIAPITVLADTPAEVKSEIGRCISMREAASEDAIVLANDLLARTDLGVGDRIMTVACLAGAQAVTADADAAAESISNALALLDKSNTTPVERMRGHAILADVLLAIGDDRRALASATIAQDLAHELGDLKMQEILLVNLSRLYADYLDELDHSIELLQQAMELAATQGREDPHLTFFYGMNLVRGKRYEEAMPALDRALQLMPKGAVGPAEMAVLRINTHRAEVFQSRGETDRARSLLDTSVTEQRRLNDAIGLAVSLTKLARLQVQLGELDSALGNAEEAVELAMRGKFRLETRQALDALADVHGARGELAPALATLRRSHALDADYLRTQNVRVLAGMQAQMSNQTAQLSLTHAERLRAFAFGALILTLTFGAGIAVIQSYRYRRLNITSMTDPLTSVLNRRGAMQRLDAGELDPSTAEVDQDASRGVLMLLDVDHFKSINDRYGHPVGDEVLRAISKRVKGLCSRHDIVARWGGEEFLIACNNMTPVQAEQLAERIRSAFEGVPVITHENEDVKVTVSLGFAPHGFFPGEIQDRWQDSLALADHALYCAKHSGRNAWIGLWGMQAGVGTPLHIVRQFTERAQTKGWIKVLGSRTHNMIDGTAVEQHEFLTRA
ncbi:MAG: diguanylate cyclase [Dokdonella sp.]